MFEKVLVALDGSEAAEGALEYAQSLSDYYQSEIILVRARSSALTFGMWDNYLMLECDFEAERKACEDYLEGQRLKLSSNGCRVSVQLLADPPAETILLVAENREVDLILLSSHGRTGINRFLLGSVAERVARHATCPVMIVGRRAREAEQLGPELPQQA